MAPCSLIRAVYLTSKPLLVRFFLLSCLPIPPRLYILSMLKLDPISSTFGACGTWRPLVVHICVICVPCPGEELGKVELLKCKLW